MLPKEKQVCSLELSQKLEKLGVNQESFFYWVGFENNKYHLFQKWEIKNVDSNKILPAYTSAELGEMLPSGIMSFKCNKFHIYNKKGKKWWCDFMPGCRPAGNKENPKCFEDTEADSRAKMLIYLLENDLIVL